jgi:hypothetical protein
VASVVHVVLSPSLSHSPSPLSHSHSSSFILAFTLAPCRCRVCVCVCVCLLLPCACAALPPAVWCCCPVSCWPCCGPPSHCRGPGDLRGCHQLGAVCQCIVDTHPPNAPSPIPAVAPLSPHRFRRPFTVVPVTVTIPDARSSLPLVLSPTCKHRCPGFLSHVGWCLLFSCSGHHCSDCCVPLRVVPGARVQRQDVPRAVRGCPLFLCLHPCHSCCWVPVCALPVCALPVCKFLCP